MKNSLIIKSRSLEQEFYFFGTGSYIFVYVGEEKEPSQICMGGGFLGATACYNEELEGDFERVCRNWYRAYLKYSFEE